MPNIRYMVMGVSNTGGLDVRFRLNVGTQVIERTITVFFAPGDTIDSLLARNVPYQVLLDIAAGRGLIQYVGRRGTITVPDPPPP